MFTLQPLTIVLPSREDKNHLLSTWTYIFHSSASSPESCCRSNINADDLIWKQQKLRGFLCWQFEWTQMVWKSKPVNFRLKKKTFKWNFLIKQKCYWKFWSTSHWKNVLCLCSPADHSQYTHRAAYGVLFLGLGQTDPDSRVFHAVYLAPALAAPTGAYTVSTYAWLCYGTDCLPHGMPHQPLWGRCQGKA